MGLKDRLKSTTAEASSDECAPQPMRAAVKSGEWSDFVEDVDREHAWRYGRERDSEFDSEPESAIDAEFATMFLATSPPSSSSTAIGPFGLTTERKVRTLDPREPSVETTRLDLFTSPAPGAPAVGTSPKACAGEPVPPSYRTRVGLYYLPRDPATEPTLPLADLAYGDETTDRDILPPRARARAREQRSQPTQTPRMPRLPKTGCLQGWLKGLVERLYFR